MANQAAYLDVASSLRRRTFLQRTAAGIGMAALANICQAAPPAAKSGLADLPHIPPQAKRVIFLHQSGAPSQLDLFDPKPETKRRHGTELPESIRQGQRLTTMTAEQKSKPIAWRRDIGSADMSTAARGLTIERCMPAGANAVEETRARAHSIIKESSLFKKAERE